MAPFQAPARQIATSSSLVFVGMKLKTTASRGYKNRWHGSLQL